MPRCWLTSSEGELSSVLTRRQSPVTSCFAVSVNRAQGQTLERVGIFLRRPLFSHGQLYVVVSRATSRQNLRFMVIGCSSTLPDGSHGIFTAIPSTKRCSMAQGDGDDGLHVRCPRIIEKREVAGEGGALFFFFFYPPADG